MNRLYGLIGLCMRAGKLACGAPACEDAIRSGKAYLVLLDAGAAAGTKKSVRNACIYRGIPLAQIAPEELGRITGRPGRMAAAVLEVGFAKEIGKRLQEADCDIQFG